MSSWYSANMVISLFCLFMLHNTLCFSVLNLCVTLSPCMLLTVSIAQAKWKKIPVFRVARPYLNLPVKPRIFLRFSGKNIILCILKGEMPFKMNKIIFFPEKKLIIKNVCLSYLKFSDLLPETHLYFIWPHPSHTEQLLREWINLRTF